MASKQSILLLLFGQIVTRAILARRLVFFHSWCTIADQKALSLVGIFPHTLSVLSYQSGPEPLPIVGRHDLAEGPVLDWELRPSMFG